MSEQEVLILVVDDQEAVRAALVELLGTAGYRAAEAADGLAAINQVEALRPALVLMDVRMPVMDGVDATREICRRFPGTLVVAHSAYQDATLVRDMISSGAKGYVLKGAGGSEVIKAIRSTLEQKSSISDGVARPILDDLESLYRREQERAERLASLVGDAAGGGDRPRDRALHPPVLPRASQRRTAGRGPAQPGALPGYLRCRRLQAGE